MNVLKTFLTQSFKPRSVKSQIQSLCLSLQTGKAENNLTCCIHLWKPIIEQPVTWRKHVKWCCSWSSVSSVWFSGKDVKMCQDEHVDAISAALTCCYFLRPGNGSRFLEESCILLPESKWNTELVLVLPIYFRGIVWETLSRFLQTHLFHLIIAALWILLLFCSFSFMELIFLTLILNPMFFFLTAQTHSVLCKAVWIAWMKKRKTHKKLLYLAFGLMNNKKCLNSVWQILIKSTHT